MANEFIIRKGFKSQEDSQITGSISLSGSFKDQESSSGTAGQVLSSTVSGSQWVDAADSSAITGTGTTGKITKWTTGGSVIGDSIITEAASAITVGGAATFSSGVDVVGTLDVGDTLTTLQLSAATASIIATSNWGITENNPIITFGRNGLAVKGEIGYDDPNTSLYIGTTTPHKFSIRTNNTTALTISSGGLATFSGDVGVSSSTKAVWGGYSSINGNYSSAFSWNALQLGNNGENYIVAGHNVVGGSLKFYVNNTSRVTDSTAPNGTLALTISSGGNVGIGTSGTPSTGLELMGADNTRATLRITNTALLGSNEWNFTPQYNSASLVISNFTNTILTLSSGGNATFSGNVKIDTNGGDGALGGTLRLFSKNANANARNWALINTWSNYGDLTFRVGDAQGDDPLTNGSTKMVITSGGLVKINPGTANNTSYDALVLAGGANSTSGSGAKMYLSGTANDPIARGTIIEGLMTDNANGHSLVFSTSSANSSPTERMRITSGGTLQVYGTASANALSIDHSSSNDVLISIPFQSVNQDFVIRNSSAGVNLDYAATSWVSASDENIKENITSLDNVLDKIKNIRCVNYNLKDEEIYKKRLGFIAQDFQEDFEEVVGESSDGVLGLHYTETIPILMKAIQEQQTIIESQKSLIDGLTTRIETLEG